MGGSFLRYFVSEIGWGVFRINGNMYVWDDYEDDPDNHCGYGMLVSYDGTHCLGEIMNIVRDGDDRVRAMDVSSF